MNPEKVKAAKLINDCDISEEEDLTPANSLKIKEMKVTTLTTNIVKNA